MLLSNVVFLDFDWELKHLLCFGLLFIDGFYLLLGAGGLEWGPSNFARVYKISGFQQKSLYLCDCNFVLAESHCCDLAHISAK